MKNTIFETTIGSVSMRYDPTMEPIEDFAIINGCVVICDMR